LPREARQNCWIVAVNEEEPIVASSADEMLQRLQRSAPDMIKLALHGRETLDCTSLDENRAAFDKVRPIISHIMFKTDRPLTPSNIGSALTNKDKQHWKEALFHQHEKNAALGLTSAPIPRSDLPTETKVFRSVIACKVKNTDDKHMWKFQARHCVNGKDMEKGIDFEESYSPVVEPATIRATVAISASETLTLGVLDVTNAFQNTIKDPNSRMHVTIPPHYLQWFKHCFPNVKTQENKTGCCLQVCNGMQGDKAAGREWNVILNKALCVFGFIRIPTDHGCYV